MRAIRFFCLFGLMLALPAFAQEGLTAKEILIGQSAGFSGAVGPLVKELTEGAKACFQAVNSRGGVHGRKIVLESMDDGFEPKRTAENTRSLIELKKVFALFLYRGTPTTEAALPIVAEARIPLVGPSTGAQTMYTPQNRYLFPVRASFYYEMGKIAEQLATLGLTRIAVIRADDSFGKDGMTGLETQLRGRGMGASVVATYPRNTTNVDEAVRKVLPVQPQAVVMISAANAATAIVKQMKKAGAEPLFIMPSTGSSDSFIKGLGEEGRGVAVTQVTPYPWGADARVAREYRQAMKDAGSSTISYASFEGYLAARVLVEGLKRAGKALNREKLVGALESMREYDLGG
ncbi:MAG: ABC transporter substrate-binding protein, partial [Xanthomonadales bacterium]|nr:ABC transporter substrate-binding protein [Xanthomonadales bacterium]